MKIRTFGFVSSFVLRASNFIKIFSLSFFIFLSFYNLAFAQTTQRQAEDAFYAAAKAYQDGAYDISLALFERFLETGADSAKKQEALVYAGQCYFFQGKYLAALDHFESLLKAEGAEPVRDKVLFWLGEIYARGRDYQHAIEFYQELIKDYGHSFYGSGAYKSLARAQFHNGQFREAITTYRAILAQAKDSSSAEEASFAICESLYRIKDYVRLKKELLDFINRYPQSNLGGRVYFYLGEADFYLGQYAEAIAAYANIPDDSLETPENILARIGRGWSYLKLRQYEKAEEQFSLFPDASAPLGVLLGKAILESAQGRDRQALDLFERVITLDKKGESQAAAHFGKAQSLFSLARFDEAIASYRAAQACSSAGPHKIDSADYFIGSAYFQKGDFRSAARALEHFLERFGVSPLRPEALLLLGEAYARMGSEAEAKKSFSLLLTSFPDANIPPDVLLWLGESYFVQKDFLNARKYFERLIRGFSGHELSADAFLRLGAMAQAEANPRAALRNFQMAEESVSAANCARIAEIQFNIAQTLEELNQVPAAIESYLKIFSLCPDEKKWASRALLRAAKIYEDREEWPELKGVLEKLLAYSAEEAEYARQKLAALRNQILVKD